jgi:hypothetical protein
MKTAEEVAEEMYRDIVGYLDRICTREDRTRIIQSFSEDLTAFASERVREAINEDRKVACDGFKYEKAIAIEDASNAALEKAAKLADIHEEGSDWNLAEAIRAMKKP